MRRDCTLCYRPRVVRRAYALIVAVALPGVLLGSCGGDLPGPSVCSERTPCDKGRVCVLGRCRMEGTTPVSERAPRLVFEPEDMGLYTGERALPLSEMGPAIALGQRGSSALLLMRFAVSYPPGARLQRAFLALDPLPDCARRPGRVTLELAQVLSPWRSIDLSHERLPKMTVPMRAATVSATPAHPLRLDVTELVRQWGRTRERYYGLALLADGDSDTGACYTSGLEWGAGPRLEIYLWPKEPKDAGVDADAEPDAGDDAGGRAADAGDGGA